MRKKLTVLFAEPPPERRVGGIETALSSLADALRTIGHNVRRESAPQRFDIAHVDLVHFHGLWEFSHYRARRCCQHLQKRMIVSPHGMLEDWAFRHRGWKKRPYFHLIERPSVARANVILATSEMETGPLLRWFPSEKIRVLPLGGHPPASLRPPAEARSHLGLRSDDYVILFLSRCHEKKGLHLLIEALPQAAVNSACPIHLLIVGDGDRAYVDPLRHQTEGWSGNLRCTWAGSVWGDEKWSYFSAADLMCLPSYSENFGLAVLEALFAGTPVLTTDATPWPALRGSLPLFFTPPSVAELVPALRQQIEGSRAGEAERTATRQEAVNTFNWSTLAPRYAELYSELADSV